MQRRTIAILGATLLAGALALGTFGSTFAQTQPQPGYGPGGMMGGYGPGLGGMMGGFGPGGMMGGYGPGPGGMMGGAWQGAQPQAQPLGSLDAARQAFQAYLDRTGNKDLALDEVMEFQNNFYAIANDQRTGQGAFELLADKQTGAVFLEMGPGMMWNTTYGPMAGAGSFGWGMMGGWLGQQAPSAQPTVTAEKAQQLAQQWLDQYQPGGVVDAPDSLPGYFTAHITQAGAITGMLSVNAATGQVWYHTWHGAFVAQTGM